MAQAGQVGSQEPGVPSRSPTWLQEPKDLGFHLLLFQVVSRELDQKCSNGMPVLQAKAQPAKPGASSEFYSFAIIQLMPFLESRI